MNRELTVEESLLQLATDYLGLKEIVGPKHNPVIVQMFKDIGHGWVKDDETAWCSAILSWICLKLELQRSNMLNAKSWMQVGVVENDPVPGSIVVFWRVTKDSGYAHVGIFVGYTISGQIFVLGGNQKNEYNISVYNKAQLLGFRKLSKL